MKKTNLLLLCGGGSSEHAISLLSAQYIESTLSTFDNYNLLRLELNADGQYLTATGEICSLTNRQITFSDESQAPWSVDYVIPCIHGYPGETGDIQSCFELMNLAYFGCRPEASMICFNKITAKMWFSALEIPNTPYFVLDSYSTEAINKTKQALSNWGSVFVKASNQGSSIGCFQITNEQQVDDLLKQAFSFSPYVIVEKTILARELEVAVFEYNGDVVATLPGEIICAQNTFYSFDEKYNQSSKAVTHIVAKDLDQATITQIKAYAIKAFKGLKLRHLSRIDFFVTHENDILLNEINTFPGLTPISMFPKMMINYGVDFGQWLTQTVDSQIRKS